jgi:hypothetical protein
MFSGILRRARSEGPSVVLVLLTAALAVGCGSDSEDSTPSKHDAGDSGTGGTDGGTDGKAGNDAGPDADAGCPSDSVSCNGQCVSIDDPAYGCGDGSCQPCAPAHATATCSSGACAVDQCDPGYSDCDADASNGCEAQLDSDPDNCGACGTGCIAPHATAVCSSGQCGIGSCDSGFVDCNTDATDGCEANIDADPDNCGDCGVVCPATGGNPVCSLGQCEISNCPTGTEECDGNPATVCETDLNTDAANCGFCGNACSLANATSNCSAGACAVTACNSGFADCDGNPANGCEVNLDLSSQNCGGCAKACTNPNGTTTCVSSVCVPNCSGGSDDCDGDPANGCETSTATDPQNCGACSVACGTSNGTAGCAAGQCTIACNSGFGDCDGSALNGCESQLNSSANCGACNTACNPANGTGSCASGACTVTSCNSGYDDCDGNASNGCEVNLAIDAQHCGDCTTACNASGGTPSCSGGACGISCSSGFGNCDGSALNGCETNLGTTTNCGACGNACSNAHGSTACTGGSCAPSCASGYGDCNGNASDGCETNTNQSTNNCGGCGTACSCPNGTPNCVSGSCGCATCSSGTADCDGNSGNGCETNTQTSVNNCGACGTVCSPAHGTPSCGGGTCSIACSGGWGNCDGNAQTNGCETQLNTLTNCGNCGTSCSLANASASCSTGSCQFVSCNSGFGNCDGNNGNGCETNTQGSVSNCGACGTVCSNAHGTPSCGAGACSIVCSGGWGNCDGNAQTNGCETQLNTLTNCGTCGTGCSLPNATTSCSTGSCQFVSCSSGFGNCDGSTGNGCETSLNTVSNCGACGTSCSNAHGSTSCGASGCAPVCSGGWGDCNGNPNDGCETSLTTLTNCASCGTACNLPNAASSCSTGSCQIASCNVGFGNCDGSAGNGCETNLNTVSNCGSCGLSCSGANGTPSCSSGICAIACSPGWGNCDGNAQLNGCETNLNNNNAHCGTCAIACGPTQTCVSGVCQSSGAVCGNGAIESGEQCDDGNTLNLDGCNSVCKYEEVQRVTQLLVRRDSPSPNFCSPMTNQFGTALSSSAANSFNSSLQTDIDNGVLNTMLDFLGLDDLTGVSDSALDVGVVNGVLDPKKGAWSPPGAIDWWFLANAADINGSGIPLYKLSPSSIASRVLTGGPSTVILNYNGSPLTMLGANLTAQIGTTTSVPAPPPSALAAGLTAFETMSANGTGLGLCGNITVGSLAAIPAPQELASGGSNACRSQCSNSLSYTYCGAGNPVGPSCNSLLDVLVGGCRVTILCITAITKKQPDVGVGGNPPNTLTNGTNNKVTVSQPNDAYSSYFRFNSKRAHITNNLP